MNTLNATALAVGSRAGPDQTECVTQTQISQDGNSMNTLRRWALGAAAAAMMLAAGGCESMSRQEKNTAIGAGAGAVGGAVLTGGSAIGTAAGAAVGGVIGHEVDTDSKKD